MQRLLLRSARQKIPSASHSRLFSSIAPSPSLGRSQPNSLDEFTSQDGLLDTYRTLEPTSSQMNALSDPTGRLHHYAIMGGVRVVYASLARISVVKLVQFVSPSADVLAMGTIEVDVSGIAEGQCSTVKWRGKPIFIKHRSAEQIAKAEEDDSNPALVDPQKDSERTKRPDWMVVIGICTHLGCVPVHGAGDFGAWFCPCHGSHYDMSGRIRKGPAPLNLEVPPVSWKGNILKIG